MSKLLEQVLQANIYLQPVQFSLVTVINILNIRVLCSRALRSSSCTHYFLAYSIFSIIYNCLACLTQFLRGFSIDWATNRIGCKIHFYILFVIPFQANLMLILASFDRYYSSYKSHLLHSKSTIQTPRIIIVIGTIASAIYMSPMLVIYYWNETTRSCYLYTNTMIHIYIFSQIFLYYILAPLLMIIFGFLTISNIRRQSMGLIYLTVSMRRRRTERQLTRMLLLQVGVHLILVLPFGIIYCMNALKPSTRTPDVLAIRYILLMWQQLDYFISFFLYFLSARIYREQLIYLLKFNNFYHT
ncbi:unnamed protein product [Rotaria sordida]|uniref:G-protein coupled receptors family 1 profile domain-containing protein n=1 Tax=Rotaria sordida TaxID=392033 RepID=A0A815EZ03_9BILA|nr:unnamed protein product [Rotaria sordida]CAF1318770.1 unnamed protein product [Rotaria sordida]CAF3737958.1 unnamed protein product [Rotaria sordida]CAF3791629.1 unnamed protein product [Rotaria sordida]